MGHQRTDDRLAREERSFRRISLYHFRADQIKRSEGRSAIAAAAYRSGEKLVSEYDGTKHDYRRKGGIIHTEILLPENAPPEYADRSTLWNAVEMFEKRKDAQLAFSFDIALQTEFGMEENITLARRFIQENFVDRGMIADWAVHDPDHRNGIQNPHFHVMCTMRPLNPDGSFGPKRRKEDGKWVKSTDWFDPEVLEQWRANWAELCNRKFEEKGLPERIDHRSYERQGNQMIPTVHEGPAVHAMEARGIRTRKGTMNRWIRAANAAIRKLIARIAEIKAWLAEHREAITEEPDTLVKLLDEYYNTRRIQSLQRGYHHPSKQDRQEQLDLMSYIAANRLADTADLEAKINSISTAADTLRTDLHEIESKLKNTSDAIDYANLFLAVSPVYEQYNTIHFKKRREKFYTEHSPELKQFYMARRKLKELMGSDFKVSEASVHRLELEAARLSGMRTDIVDRLKPLTDETKTLSSIRHKVDKALKNRQTESEPQKAKPEKEAAR